MVVFFSNWLPAASPSGISGSSDARADVELPASSTGLTVSCAHHPLASISTSSELRSLLDRNVSDALSDAAEVLSEVLAGEVLPLERQHVAQTEA